MQEKIIIVNENDEEIGYGDKMSVHMRGDLHRAFSLFIFDQDRQEMLLQRRAFGKYHSGGLWTNACCSHPHKGEKMSECLRKRLKFEIGIDIPFKIVPTLKAYSFLAENFEVLECGSFLYRHSFGEISENEIDHVFLYCFQSKKRDLVLYANFDEISDLKWISIDELEKWLAEKPGEFTVWFSRAYAMVKPRIDMIRELSLK